MAKLSKEKLVVVLVAVGIVLLAFGMLFEVRLRPSSWMRQLVKQVRPVKTVPKSEVDYQTLAAKVIPAEGKVVKVAWADMGRKLVKAGAINMAKWEENFPSMSDDQRQVLEGEDVQEIKFTQENIVFWTDVLWALGLTQRSKVLSQGPMWQNREQTPIGNYAATGGWTLGTKKATQLYNSEALIQLTSEQDDLVYGIAENIYRPCCGNSAAYPDCNHGMAVLGLLELMAATGASEAEMYDAALAFNTYAFADTYINAAADLASQGKDWGSVEAKLMLGYDYSSGRGASGVAKRVGEISGAPKRGVGCGV